MAYAGVNEQGVMTMVSLLRPRPGVEAAMAAVLGRVPFDTPQVAEGSPPGSLGAHYAHYMRMAGLGSFFDRDEFRQLAVTHPFGSRLLYVHDFLHVLLDVDSSYPSELAIWAFKAAQGVSDQLHVIFESAHFGFALLAPEAGADLERMAARGAELGRRAAMVFAYPFEDNLDRPLAEVRDALRVEVA